MDSVVKTCIRLDVKLRLNTLTAYYMLGLGKGGVTRRSAEEGSR